MAKTECEPFAGNLTTPTGVKFDGTGFALGLHLEDVVIPAAFGSRWKKHDLGPGDMTGSFHGTAVYGAADTNPLNVGTTNWANFKASCVFTFAAGCTVTMDIAVRDVEITREHGQIVTITCNWANAGEPTIVWASGS